MEKLNYSKGAPALYLQISEILKEDIEKKKYKFNDVIPGENELTSLFDVSRITIRQAIAELEKEGYVKRERGIGTTVIYRNSVTELLTSIKSFTVEMEERGIVPSTKEVIINKVKADSKVAELFNIKKNDDIILLHRVRCADGEPIVIFDTYLSCEYKFPMNKKEYLNSMYEVFEKVGLSKPVKVKEKFVACLPNFKQAKELNIKENDPIFKRERISYDKDNKIIEYSLCYYRGDSYTYEVEYGN